MCLGWKMGEVPAGTYTQRTRSYKEMSKRQPWTHLLMPPLLRFTWGHRHANYSHLSSLIKRYFMWHYCTLLLISSNRNGRHATSKFHSSLKKIRNSEAMWKSSQWSRQLSNKTTDLPTRLGHTDPSALQPISLNFGKALQPSEKSKQSFC